MTRKHFVAIAGIIKLFYTNAKSKRLLESIVNSLCDFFEKENNLFDRDRFIKACGIEPR